MTRRFFRMLVLPSIVAIALVFAPSIALAQDADSDLPVYPGPFSETVEDTTDSSTSESTDEVLGEARDNLSRFEENLLADRSIDYIGDDAATSFIAPDIQPSEVTTTAAATGTTGPGLANTGSNVEPIIAISVGMLAVGGSVLVSSRRRLRDFFS